jgi:chemotaxis protein MotB
MADGLGPVALAAIALAGCNQNAYLPPSTAAWQQQIQPEQARAHELNERATALDQNNQDLHAKLAQSRQQVQLLQEQISLLQEQLGETAERLQEAQIAKREAEQKYAALQETTKRRGGAFITAGNSVRGALRAVSIEGVEVREDGDRIRIVLPADQLFAAGTAQPVGSAFPLLDRVAAEISRNYPRQRIGIEGHTDTTPAQGNVSHHQLAAAQAVAVFDQLTRRNRLPARQFFVQAQGPNRPRDSNATRAGRAQNRRIELVVYPETAEGF